MYFFTFDAKSEEFRRHNFACVVLSGALSDFLQNLTCRRAHPRIGTRRALVYMISAEVLSKHRRTL